MQEVESVEGLREDQDITNRGLNGEDVTTSSQPLSAPSPKSGQLTLQAASRFLGRSCARDG